MSCKFLTVRFNRHHRLVAPLSSSSTSLSLRIVMFHNEQREFSSSRQHMEEEKKSKSIWGNIMEFVDTFRQGRKLKKVEEEMKKNYSKLVASALLEVCIDEY